MNDGAQPGLAPTDPSPDPGTEAAYREALAWHLQGHLAQAQAGYRRLLAAQPGHLEGLHMLGVIAIQMGDLAAAVELLGQVLVMAPDDGAAHTHLGTALQESGRHEDALAAFDRALQIDPLSFDALNNRGNCLRDLKRLEESLASYGRALQIRSDDAAVLYNHALVSNDLHQGEQALADVERLLRMTPDEPRVLNLRGNLLKDLGRLDAALSSYQRVLRIDPANGEALNNRGIVLLTQNRPQAALASLAQALRVEANKAAVLMNQSLALHRLWRLEEAAASLEEALRLDPELAEAHYLRGLVLRDLDQPAAALASQERCLVIAPEHRKALDQQVRLLTDLRRHPEAVKTLSRLLAIAPDHPFAVGHGLYLRVLDYDWHEYTQTCARILEGLHDGRPVTTPFAFLAVSDRASEQLRCARLFAAVTAPPRPRGGHRQGKRGRRQGSDRVRLAYVSPDFREHPMAGLMMQVFETHDRTRFETLAVSLGAPDQSETGLRLREAFDRFLEVRAERDDAVVAHQLRDLGVDIAIDLAGHTANSRLGIFAHRAAPVQVNYLGFVGTLGADYIDYILADDLLIPRDLQDQYAEHVAYLPDCYQANDNHKPIGTLTRSRAQLGLPAAGFVFGALNNGFKCTPAVFDIWMRLLAAVPGSVLWLLVDNGYAINNIRREAAARGIDPARIVGAARANYPDHLARMRLADLALDTWPLNGGATTSDLLWAGLPVVTCMGEAYASRMSASLLRAVGLPELVTESLPDYEALALRLATSPELLASIRERLAQNRLTYPLFDTQRFRRHLEAAYLTMWERQQRGLPPRGFTVAPLA